MAQLSLMMTRNCTAKCSFCYQRQSGERMSFEVAREAVAAFLNVPAETHRISFFGGEPLLNRKLVREVVDFAQHHAARPELLSFSLTSNGQLLDNDTLAWLDINRFHLFISVHSFAGGTSARGCIGFDIIDDALARMAAHTPALLGRLSALIMVAPENVDHLGEMYRALAARGVPAVSFEGDIRETGENSAGFIASLQRAFDDILSISRALARAGKRVPFAALTKEDGTDFTTPLSDWREEDKCALLSPGWKAVDTNGDLYACALLMKDLVRTSPNGPLPAAMNGLKIGNLSCPGDWVVEDVYLDEMKRRLGPYLLGLKFRRGREGFCRECAYANTCFICPLVLSIVENNPVPKVPDHLCALRSETGRIVSLWRQEIAADPSKDDRLPADACNSGFRDFRSSALRPKTFPAPQ